MTLCRLRANPKKIRITVRPMPGKYWRVTVASIEKEEYVTEYSKSPKKALVRALRRAERFEMDGIDMDMQWTYEHPQKKDLSVEDYKSILRSILELASMPQWRDDSIVLLCSNALDIKIGYK